MNMLMNQILEFEPIILNSLMIFVHLLCELFSKLEL